MENRKIPKNANVQFIKCDHELSYFGGKKHELIEEFNALYKRIIEIKKEIVELDKKIYPLSKQHKYFMKYKLSNRLIHKKRNKGKAVIRTNINGSNAMKFRSIAEAAAYNGISPTTIKKIANGGQTECEYNFSIIG